MPTIKGGNYPRGSRSESAARLTHLFSHCRVIQLLLSGEGKRGRERRGWKFNPRSLGRLSFDLLHLQKFREKFNDGAWKKRGKSRWGLIQREWFIRASPFFSGDPAAEEQERAGLFRRLHHRQAAVAAAAQAAAAATTTPGAAAAQNWGGREVR